MARRRLARGKQFRPGDRVMLFAVGDCSKQYGEVIEGNKNGVVTVRVDEKWREADDRDGLCEVPPQDLRLTTIREDREVLR